MVTKHKVIVKGGKKIVKLVKVPEEVSTAINTSNAKKLDENNQTDETVTQTTRDIIPPHDIFSKFNRYFESNYEQLVDAVNDLYCEKPQLEFAVNVYGVYDNEEEAEKFKKKHADEVITTVYTGKTGQWSFLAPTIEQRESVNYYNKDTVIMEEMQKQLERDEKLGRDLMSKTIKKEKKKNELIAGKDDESFIKWRAQNTDLSRLGAKYLGDQASEDIPDDAIQVDVWKIAKGGLEIEKSKFYTKAEAPNVS